MKRKRRKPSIVDSWIIVDARRSWIRYRSVTVPREGCLMGSWAREITMSSGQVMDDGETSPLRPMGRRMIFVMDPRLSTRSSPSRPRLDAAYIQPHPTQMDVPPRWTMHGEAIMIHCSCTFKLALHRSRFERLISGRRCSGWE